MKIVDNFSRVVEARHADVVEKNIPLFVLKGDCTRCPLSITMVNSRFQDSFC